MSLRKISSRSIRQRELQSLRQQRPLHDNPQSSKNRDSGCQRKTRVSKERGRVGNGNVRSGTGHRMRYRENQNPTVLAEDEIALACCRLVNNNFRSEVRTPRLRGHGTSTQGGAGHRDNQHHENVGHRKRAVVKGHHREWSGNHVADHRATRIV